MDPVCLCSLNAFVRLRDDVGREGYGIDSSSDLPYKDFMVFDLTQIDPIAFSLGPFHIRWYALAYLAGFVLGWRYALRLAGLYGGRRPDRADIDDFLTWAVLGVILGGRLGYVLFYQPEYYLENPLEALKIWKGGMAFHGGAAGVILAIILFSWRRGFSIFRLGDIVCAAVPIGLFFGRLANFVNGELYGRPADVAWAMKFPGGGDALRHPSQLYEAGLEGLLLFLILFVLIRIRAVRERPGIIAGAFLAGYGVFRSLVEFFREPDAQLGFILGEFSMGQILSLPMVIAGLVMIGYAVIKHKTSAAQSA